jgi:VWFA-related protein
VTVTALAVFALLCGTLRAHGQTANSNEAPFHLKAASKLVVVRVVVRDAQGKPVAGLHKADFKLFDQDKEQSITQFEEETSAAPVVPPSGPAAVPAPKQETPPPPAMPGRFTALYFDDLNTSDTDLIQARDAADRYLSANLQPCDRVAIFTSEQMLSDFTSGPKQIHEALLKLRANPRAPTRIHDCPDLSDYQALEITENADQNTDAWKTAIDEAQHCDSGSVQMPSIQNGGGPGSGKPVSANPGLASGASATIRIMAQNIVNQAQILAHLNLQRLEHVVKYTSQMPGRRTVILVSPGFMWQSEQLQLDRIIDRALRSQVVISSLDPKGLVVLMREFDASRSYIPATNSAMLGAARRMDSEREFVAAGVLADVAQDTGGEFFHNDNDLKAGFGALEGSPVYYILAFAPKDIKHDGKFHALKVTLAEKQKGFTIQARHGYFAPTNEAGPAAEAKETEAPDVVAQAQEQVREATLSRAEFRQLPMALTTSTKPSAGQSETRELSLSAHLDARSLHFHKDGEHNLNTVTFVFAVFDQKENLLVAQLRRARANVLDEQLPRLFKAGLDVDVTFHLKPGIYRIRAVVTDSEDRHMTALSRTVEVQ